jgi:anti-sigma B factor antagonist
MSPLLLTPNFDIESVSIGDAIVVEVSGDVDLLTAPALSEELRRAQRTRSRVIVDLEKVDFMDCAALHVLANAATAPGPGEPLIAVTPGPPQVQKLFRLTGIDRMLRIIDRPREHHRVVPATPLLWDGPVAAHPAADAA